MVRSRKAQPQKCGVEFTLHSNDGTPVHTQPRNQRSPHSGIYSSGLNQARQIRHADPRDGDLGDDDDPRCPFAAQQPLSSILYVQVAIGLCPEIALIKVVHAHKSVFSARRVARPSRVHGDAAFGKTQQAS
jgi:hypothetical protein